MKKAGEKIGNKNIHKADLKMQATDTKHLKKVKIGRKSKNHKGLVFNAGLTK